MRGITCPSDIPPEFGEVVMQWFRLHHEAATDPKMGVAAKRASKTLGEKVPKGAALAVWVHALTHASEADERGSIATLDPEVVEEATDFPAAWVERILAEFRALGMIEGERIAAWDKRQPQKVDRTNATRQRRYRQRHKGEDTVTPVTPVTGDVTDDDDDEGGPEGSGSGSEGSQGARYGAAPEPAETLGKGAGVTPVTDVTPRNGSLPSVLICSVTTSSTSTDTSTHTDISRSVTGAGDGQGALPVVAGGNVVAIRKGLGEEQLKGEFHHFYAAYPRKKEPMDAFKAYSKARRAGASYEAIMHGLQAEVAGWQAAGRPKDKTPYPASWLNATGWMSEPDEAPVKKGNFHGSEDLSADPDFRAGFGAAFADVLAARGPAPQ
jgi:hypothetical protein